MRRIWQLLIALFLVAVSSYSIAQEVEKRGKDADKPGEEAESSELTIARVLRASVTHANRMMFAMAMAMPEDKYGFAPTNGEFKGVRNFGQQIKHVAAANFVYAAAILGEKPPVDVGENEDGPAALKTKAETIQYMKHSFAYVQKAVATVSEKNVITPFKNPFGEGQATRLSMVIFIVGHCDDHYGQLDQYLRMNGLETPAGRR
jgi:uncharacterized damage-inducible protein DinB